MSSTGWLTIAGAWFLTYLAHSTLMLGAVLGVSRWVGRRSLASEEALWRGALLGAILTASLQLGLGWHPWSPTWQVASAPAPDGSPAMSSVVPAPAARWVASEALKTRHHTARSLGAGTSEALAEMSTVPRALRAPSRAMGRSWLPVALVAYLLVASLLALSVARAHQWLRRRLRTRARVIESPTIGQLARLTKAARFSEPVDLTCSSRLPVPVALGLKRAEICVPPRALFLLSDEEQEGLIAHELAHIVRRDLRWMVVTTLVTRVLFFQPLNWVASRRLRQISELIADEWAVARTGRPQSLARCLTEVAGWSFSLLRPLPVPGAAQPGSQLQQRVRRLLESQRTGTAPLRRESVVIVGLLTAAVMVLAAPSFGTGRADSATAAPAAPAAQAAPARAASSPTPAEAPEAPAIEEDLEAPAVAEEIDAPPVPPAPALAPLPSAPAIMAMGLAPLAPLPAVAFSVSSFPDPEEDEELAEEEARLTKAEAELDSIDEHTDRAPRALDRAARDIARASEGLTENIDRELSALKPELDRLQKQLVHLRTDRLVAQGAAMEELSGSLGELKLGLSEADAEKLSHSLSLSLATGNTELSKEIATRLKAQMDEASQAIKKYTNLASRDWDKRFQEQMDEMRAARKMDFDKLHQQLRVSEEQRRKIIDETRRLGESSRPTADELKALRELARNQAELVRRSLEDNRRLIDATRRTIDQQMDLLRDETRREMEHARRQRDLDRHDRKAEPPPHLEESPSAPPPPPLR
jgi:beta-lactamase regulating signal transducer with metallopeptidase domain